MATRQPCMVISLVDSSNFVIEADGVAGSVSRFPAISIHLVSSTNKIIETNGVEGSATAGTINGVVVIVDSLNRVFDGSATPSGVSRYPQIAARQVGSGALAQMVCFVVDGASNELDGIYGGGGGSPSAGTLLWTVPLITQAS